jgi:hypothetical protein
MSTMDISQRAKNNRVDKLTTFVGQVSRNSGSFKFLGSLGAVQDSKVTDYTIPHKIKFINKLFKINFSYE